MTNARAMDELLRYVGFDEADVARLVALRPPAEAHFERIASAFYDRIREHEEAHAVLVDEAQIKRLHTSLMAWMRRVLSGSYGVAYYEDTWRIGVVHVRVGLPQKYMFTAMAHLRQELSRVVDGVLASPEREATRDALSKILDVDLAIMLESYADALGERIRRAQKMQEEARVAHTERRYVAAVELARLAVIGLDAAGRIQFFNRQAERVTGFAREEVDGEEFVARFIVPDRRDEFMAALAASREEDVPNEPSTIDVPLRARNGSTRMMRWQFANAPTDGVVFLMGSDRTEEHAHEERARRVEKLAAVGTLAAGLAHEIRNPLNGAQLHTAYLSRALAKQRNAPPEMVEAVSVIAEEIQRLARLTTEFLDFARPKPLAFEQVSARALVERVHALSLEDAQQAHVALRLDVPPRDVVFAGDAGRLEQVLLNLTRNAIEAVEPIGSGNVTLRIRRRPRDVLFEVEDDGAGLSTTAPIFDAFYSTKATGTGLGLAITHRIVSDHGGSISVTSDPGRTVFSVLLPLRQPERHPSPDP